MSNIKISSIKVVCPEIAFETLTKACIKRKVNTSMTENYKYMYTKDGAHYFKHIDTRKYLTTSE